MQQEEVIRLVDDLRRQKCELQTVEIKEASKGCPTRLYDTLSGFSNQDGGGVLVFGVSEKKGFEVVGVYDPQDLQHKVAEQCKQMEPAVRPLFTVADFEGKTVVTAEIPGVDVADRPVYYKGVGRVKGAYIRVGEADEPMSEYEIYSYDAYRRRVRDDIRIAEEADISQFDTSLLEKYLLAVRENRQNVQNLSDSELLDLMGITKGGKPTLTGVMCFSKYPQAAFPRLCITAVVVPGLYVGQVSSDGERFLDNQRIEGTIAQMLEGAMSFTRRNMRVSTIVDDNGNRADREEYPPKAIREAVLNALMHRDYSYHTEGTPVQIYMYKDRMEIINTGGLYGTLTIDELGKVHADTRNKTLATTLEFLKVAENRYSGIPTIREEMRQYRLPPPVFDVRRGNFKVVLSNTRQPDSEYLQPTGDIRTDILKLCREPRTREELVPLIGKTQYYAMQTYVYPMVNEGLLSLTIPDKPKSRNQRFLTTPRGLSELKNR